MKAFGIYFAAVVLLFAGVIAVRESSRQETTRRVAPVDRGREVETISTGEEVKIQDHLSEGVWTVIEFGAEWCPSCRQKGPELEALIRSKKDCNLRRVDIEKWGSPVTQQHKIERIPTLWLYNGRRFVSDNEREIRKLLQNVE